MFPVVRGSFRGGTVQASLRQQAPPIPGWHGASGSSAASVTNRFSRVRARCKRVFGSKHHLVPRDDVGRCLKGVVRAASKNMKRQTGQPARQVRDWHTPPTFPLGYGKAGWAAPRKSFPTEAKAEALRHLHQNARTRKTIESVAAQLEHTTLSHNRPHRCSFHPQSGPRTKLTVGRFIHLTCGGR